MFTLNRYFLLVMAIFSFSFQVFSFVDEVEFGFDIPEYVYFTLSSNDSLSYISWYDSSGNKSQKTMTFSPPLQNTSYLLTHKSNEVFFSSLNLSFSLLLYEEGSSLTYYGLKNQGESFTFISNLGNFSYQHSQDLGLKENESLCFSSSVGTWSSCPSFFSIFSSGGQKNLTNNSLNLSQQEEQNSTYSSNSSLSPLINDSSEDEIIYMEKNCNTSYELRVVEEVFNKTLYFSLEVNNSSYMQGLEYMYWVENELGEEVKQKRSSSHLGEKQFTPGGDVAEKLFLFVNISSDYCSNLLMAPVIYFPTTHLGYLSDLKKSHDDLISYSSSLNSSLCLEEGFLVENSTLSSGTQSYDVSICSLTDSSFSIFAGDTLLSTTQLFAKLPFSQTFLFKPEFYANTSLLFGFKNASESFLVYPPVDKTMSIQEKLSKNTKMESNLTVINVSNTSVTYQFTSNFPQFNASCIVYDKKTPLSKRIFFSTPQLLSLNFSLQSTSSLLKLSCKFKKINLTSYTYVSKEFEIDVGPQKGQLEHLQEENLREEFVDEENLLRNSSLTSEKKLVSSFHLAEPLLLSTPLVENQLTSLVLQEVELGSVGVFLKENQSSFSSYEELLQSRSSEIFLGILVVISSTLMLFW